MTEIEKGSRTFEINSVTSEVIGSPILAPRGAIKITITKIVGFLFQSSAPTSNAQWAVALVQRPANVNIGTIQQLARTGQLIWADGQGFLFSSAAAFAFNRLRIDIDLVGLHGNTARHKISGQGFQLIVEMDTTDVTVEGILDLSYEITWPDSKRTRDLGRIRRMGIMNQ